MQITTGPHPDSPPDEHAKVADDWFNEAPPWLASATIHLILLILAALLAIGTSEDPRLELIAQLSDEQGEQLLEETPELGDSLDLAIETPTVDLEAVAPMPTPMVSVEPSQESLDAEILPSNASPAITAALTGRDPSMREALLKAYGGTKETEEAVLEGLQWLQKKQRTDGSWSLMGPYPGPGRVENRNAATAMALLAFQGAGYLPDGNDRLCRPVRLGWEFLSDQQLESGQFSPGDAKDHHFYTHALCTIALCELLAMSGDDSLRPAAQRAIDYLVDTQAPPGGWRYRPLENSDLSVTGWVMMALKSGAMAGLNVPSPVFKRISDFLDTVQVPDGTRYKYVEYEVYNPESMPVMTSVGLLCRQYLGWPRSDDRLHRGVEHILQNPPVWGRRRTNVYYWYYATQVCKHMGEPMWSEWNEVMRELLPKHQEKRGRERGSWPPDGDRWGYEGGRLYQTCMSLYILEVYYRHLPLYQREAVVQR